MNRVRQATAILQIILVIMIITIIIGGIFIYWYLKKKKPSSVKNEEVDYSNLKRKDSLDYIKFDEIIDDMIIADNGNRYIAVIRCRGFDFFSAPSSQRKMAHDGYLGFINLINTPIVCRQYTKNVEMEYTISCYKKAYDKVEKELFFLSEDYNNILAEYKQKKSEGIEMDAELAYLNQLESLNKSMDNKSWIRDHIADNMDYLDDIVKNSVPETVETYTLDWTYEPLIGSKELTKEEIHKKAKRELGRKVNSFIHALSSAGVRAERVRTNELRQMNRRHWHPVTANLYTSSDVENSNFYEDITTSPALTEADYIYAEENGELNDIYNAQDKLLEEGVAESIVETTTYDKLIKSNNDELNTDDDEFTNEMLDERKNILVNHFEEAEKKKKLQDERKKQIEKQSEQRRLNAGIQKTKNGNDSKSYSDAAYSELDIGGISELFIH